MAVNPSGTTSTLDAAASQLEGLMGDDVAEEVVEAEAPDEVELTEADDERLRLSRTMLNWRSRRTRTRPRLRPWLRSPRRWGCLLRTFSRA